MRYRSGPILALVLLAWAAKPAAAQDLRWQNKWYWGVQGGAIGYFVGIRRAAPTVGAHWLITAGRSALYLGFDQQYLPRVNQIIRTGQAVSFGNAQRFQATVYAVPTDSKFQVMLGGGFAISKVTNASLTGPLTSALDERLLDDASTKAGLIVSAGWQLRTGRKLAIFGQYQYMPGNADYVIRSAQHSVNLGIRYAVTHSQEVVSTER